MVEIGKAYDTDKQQPNIRTCTYECSNLVHEFNSSVDDLARDGGESGPGRYGRNAPNPGVASNRR